MTSHRCASTTSIVQVDDIYFLISTEAFASTCLSKNTILREKIPLIEKYQFHVHDDKKLTFQ